jgi:hypothetical protein
MYFAMLCCPSNPKLGGSVGGGVDNKLACLFIVDSLHAESFCEWRQEPAGELPNMLASHTQFLRRMTHT